MKPPEHILLSRTDSIGDVMVTLPMAGLLKQRFPGVRITFLGRSYTAPVLKHCHHVDRVLDLDVLEHYGAEAAALELRKLHIDTVLHVFPRRSVAAWCKHAGIPRRIGTAHRWWHWLTCTDRPRFSRRRSTLHEAQLNLKLLAPLGIHDTPSLQELAALSGFRAPDPDADTAAFLRPDRTRVVLHTLSRGSAVEWGMERFAALIHALDPERYQVVLTGTPAEAERYRRALPVHLPHVTDVGGRVDLERLVALIGGCHALVAASTGPLHIAAAAGIRAIGLYADTPPIHPGRWAPLGSDVHVLLAPPDQRGTDPLAQVQAITPAQVLALLETLPQR
ncbi:MAG: glycosyltransferase family 9 protein [Flavobacteriales bacterium]